MFIFLFQIIKKKNVFEFHAYQLLWLKKKVTIKINCVATLTLKTTDPEKFMRSKKV